MFVRICPYFPFSARLCLNQHHWLADSKWLQMLVPFFTSVERRVCAHRLFFSQVEYCDNLIFHRRASLDVLGDRLFDANRTIGQPNKLTTIFGRRITKRHPRLRPLSQTLRTGLRAPHLGTPSAYPGRRRHADEKRPQLDHLCHRIVTDLDALWSAVGLRSAA